MSLKNRIKAFMAANDVMSADAGKNMFRIAGNVMPGMPELTFLQAFRGWSAKCIDMRSNSISLKENFAVYPNVSGGQTPVPQNHWINPLFKMPNVPLQLSLPKIKKLLIEWLDFHGNAYLWFPLNGNKFPTQMWILESNRVWINPGTDKLIQSYSYSNQNGVFEIPANEICHFRTLHPNNKMYGSQYEGSSLYLSAALNAILSDEKKREFLKGFYESDGTLFMTMNSPQGSEPNKEYITQFKEITRNMPNINRKILGYMPDGVTLNSAPVSPLSAVAVSNDMATDKNATLICSIFGVPIGLLDGTSNTFATAQISEKLYQEQTVEPLMLDFETTLTMYLNQFDQNLTITHSPYQFSDPTTEIQKRTFDFRNGIVNRNELRAEQGKEPIPNGDIYFIDSSLVPIDTVINPPAIPEPVKSVMPTNDVPDIAKNFESEKKNPILN